MTAPYDAVLFDLDGTLIHSEPGVHVAIRHALSAFGIVPSDDELDAFMGPPLRGVLESLYGMTTEVDVERFSAGFRESYFHGAEYDYEIYPGLADLVADLCAAGVTLAIATAKPHESASRIIEHAGLAGSFAFVAGSEIDNTRQHKADVIDHALASLAVDGRSHRIAMVGDRGLDVAAARAHGIDGIAVTWGYGGIEELETSGATAIAHDASDLRRLLTN